MEHPEEGDAVRRAKPSHDECCSRSARWRSRRVLPVGRRRRSGCRPERRRVRNAGRPETTTTSPTGDRTIANVSDPSVTVFLPPPATATGAAVVVVPGGALRLLGWDNEGRQGRMVVEGARHRGPGAEVPHAASRTSRRREGSSGRCSPRGTWRGHDPAAGNGHSNANANPAPDDPALDDREEDRRARRGGRQPVTVRRDFKRRRTVSTKAPSRGVPQL